MRRLAILFFIVILAGCETTKCFLGISTKEIEQARPNAITKIFNDDLQTCYRKTESALKTIGGYIYSKKSDMFACYKSTTDTTPIGVFFKAIDPNNTQIEVSSPSSAARDDFAEKLFLILEESQ
ncbi:MAG: hypothetical protein NC936_02920 [Candidatus Omnitrophica bacterium]|nr:hypothetical protein [Candidatus Omnitrophota bacterium]